MEECGITWKIALLFTLLECVSTLPYYNHDDQKPSELYSSLSHFHLKTREVPVIESGSESVTSLGNNYFWNSGDSEEEEDLDANSVPVIQIFAGTALASTGGGHIHSSIRQGGIDLSSSRESEFHISLDNRNSCSNSEEEDFDDDSAPVIQIFKGRAFASAGGGHIHSSIRQGGIDLSSSRESEFHISLDNRNSCSNSEEEDFDDDSVPVIQIFTGRAFASAGGGRSHSSIRKSGTDSSSFSGSNIHISSDDKKSWAISDSEEKEDFDADLAPVIQIFARRAFASTGRSHSRSLVHQSDTYSPSIESSSSSSESSFHISSDDKNFRISGKSEKENNCDDDFPPVIQIFGGRAFASAGGGHGHSSIRNDIDSSYIKSLSSSTDGSSSISFSNVDGLSSSSSDIYLNADHSWANNYSEEDEDDIDDNSESEVQVTAERDFSSSNVGDLTLSSSGVNSHLSLDVENFWISSSSEEDEDDIKYDSASEVQLTRERDFSSYNVDSLTSSSGGSSSISSSNLGDLLSLSSGSRSRDTSSKSSISSSDVDGFSSTSSGNRSRDTSSKTSISSSNVGDLSSSSFGSRSHDTSSKNSISSSHISGLSSSYSGSRSRDTSSKNSIPSSHISGLSSSSSGSRSRDTSSKNSIPSSHISGLSSSSSGSKSRDTSSKNSISSSHISGLSSSSSGSRSRDTSSKNSISSSHKSGLSSLSSGSRSLDTSSKNSISSSHISGLSSSSSGSRSRDTSSKNSISSSHISDLSSSSSGSKSRDTSSKNSISSSHISGLSSSSSGTRSRDTSSKNSIISSNVDGLKLSSRGSSSTSSSNVDGLSSSSFGSRSRGTSINSLNSSSNVGSLSLSSSRSRSCDTPSETSISSTNTGGLSSSSWGSSLISSSKVGGLSSSSSQSRSRETSNKSSISSSSVGGLTSSSKGSSSTLSSNLGSLSSSSSKSRSRASLNKSSTSSTNVDGFLLSSSEVNSHIPLDAEISWTSNYSDEDEDEIEYDSESEVQVSGERDFSSSNLDDLASSSWGSSSISSSQVDNLSSSSSGSRSRASLSESSISSSNVDGLVSSSSGISSHISLDAENSWASSYSVEDEDDIDYDSASEIQVSGEKYFSSSDEDDLTSSSWRSSSILSSNDLSLLSTRSRSRATVNDNSITSSSENNSQISVDNLSDWQNDEFKSQAETLSKVISEGVEENNDRHISSYLYSIDHSHSRNELEENKEETVSENWLTTDYDNFNDSSSVEDSYEINGSDEYLPIHSYHQHYLDSGEIDVNHKKTEKLNLSYSMWRYCMKNPCHEKCHLGIRSRSC